MTTDINRATPLELIAACAPFVDVLPEREHESGQIARAVSIPPKGLDSRSVSGLRHDKLVVVC